MSSPRDVHCIAYRPVGQHNTKMASQVLLKIILKNFHLSQRPSNVLAYGLSVSVDQSALPACQQGPPNFAEEIDNYP